jgi:carbonic anhydrase
MKVPGIATIIDNKLLLSYKDASIKLENDGRMLNAVIGPGASMSVSGDPDAEGVLQYIQFHSPSEHVFVDSTGQDIRYALEMQFHHRTSEGQVNIIAVLFKVNAKNEILESIFEEIPKQCRDEEVKAKPNLEELLPFERHFYMYKGSITSPPCTDPVTWYVLREQSHLSMEQLQLLRRKIHLDPSVLPKHMQPAPAGTERGKTNIRVVDLDEYPEYEFSKTLLGNARPVQDMGTRTLWATPEVV